VNTEYQFQARFAQEHESKRPQIAACSSLELHSFRSLAISFNYIAIHGATTTATTTFFVMAFQARAKGRSIIQIRMTMWQEKLCWLDARRAEQAIRKAGVLFDRKQQQKSLIYD